MRLLICSFLLLNLVVDTSFANEIKKNINKEILSFNRSVEEEPKKNSSETDLIVISGTRTAKLLSDSAVDITVINGDTLAQVSQGTVAQALNFIPGVVITRSVKDGYNIQMQGFDSDHVLVLVDSQPLISPSGSSVDLDQISSSNIEQIEVLKGAASVLYGSSAVGGVINIITKKQSEDLTKVSYEISSYQGNEIEGKKLNHLAKINLSTTIFDWQTSADILVIDDAGFDYQQTTVKQDAASLDKHFVNLSASKNITTIDTKLGYQYFKEDKERASSSIPGQSSVISYLSNVEQQQLNLSFADELQMWKLNTRYIEHNETSGQSNSTRETQISLAEIDGQRVWAFDQDEVVAGFVLHQDKLDQFKPSDIESTNAGTVNVVEINDKARESAEAYVQGNWQLAKHQILAGVRVQHDSDFGWHHAMRLNGLVNLSERDNEIQWRMGIGESYRVPNLKERFYVFDHSNLGYMVLGSSSLTPETAVSLTSSFSYNTSIFKGNADVALQLSAHYSDTDNLIDTVLDSEKSAESGLSVFTYENIANAKISGLDISIDVLLNQWRYQLNYSYLDSENESGSRLTARPRHQIKSNIYYNFEQQDINLIAYLVYQADEAIPSGYSKTYSNHSLLLNIAVNQQLTSSFSWRFGIDNILDEHKNNEAVANGEFDVRPISSRKITAGISYQF